MFFGLHLNSNQKYNPSAPDQNIFNERGQFIGECSNFAHERKAQSRRNRILRILGFASNAPSRQDRK